MALRLGLQAQSLTRPSLLASIALSTAPPQTSTSALATTSKHDRQTVTLPDGRLLSFAEYGKSDGKPLFYFHGYPASCREAATISEEVHKRGIRLISIDRPGLGASTIQPHRTLLDWPQDVSALADHLGLQRFAVLGSSGGGPYAVACAHALSAERLTVAGVFAGAPPWEVGAHYNSANRRRLAYLAERWPTLLKGLTSTVMRVARWLLNRAWVKRKTDDWLKAVMKKAKENSDEPEEIHTQEKLDELREGIISPFMDHFEQGAAGFVQETQLLVRPWGFSFEHVKGRVQIYHGTKDTNAPIQMMRILAERLPNCDLQEFETDDHYTTGRHVADAMSKLVSEDVSKRV